MANGYYARLTADGDHVWSSRLGGTVLDYATHVAVDPWGDTLVLGVMSGPGADFGHLTLDADPGGSPFLGKLDVSGNASWLVSPPHDATVVTPNRDDLGVDPWGQVHVTGLFPDNAYMVTYSRDGALVDTHRPVSGTFQTFLSAIQGDGSVWLSGYVEPGTDFGLTESVVFSSDLFVLRLVP